jgi:hypothetical protein
MSNNTGDESFETSDTDVMVPLRYGEDILQYVAVLELEEAGSGEQPGTGEPRSRPRTRGLPSSTASEPAPGSAPTEISGWLGRR